MKTTPRNPAIMIHLDHLSKQFPGQRETAVDNLTGESPQGEIVIFVGPSGCGKTTTLKMINRIIEPTSGRIILDGEDVTRADPNLLRRRIGYVIQQVGLFPHMTIAQNIATVPKLLGWDKTRINNRIDELLDTIGMPAVKYRDRYPKDLSGGQLQRVGVARGLSGDPDVMLMDEPFGAIDPITRARLQDEFLRLQSEFRKTIVFVTHDIDEAIKMGDRIVILGEGSRVAQYGTPEEILTAPANHFVADFIGSGASLKRLKLSHVSDIKIRQCRTETITSNPRRLLERLRSSNEKRVLILDQGGRPHRWVDETSLECSESPTLDGIGLIPAVIQTHATLSDALNALVTASHSVVAVVDGSGVFQGVVDIELINQTSRGVRDETSNKKQPTGSDHNPVTNTRLGAY